MAGFFHCIDYALYLSFLRFNCSVRILYLAQYIIAWYACEAKERHKNSRRNRECANALGKSANEMGDGLT
jgi:hypothetical protein